MLPKRHRVVLRKDVEKLLRARKKLYTAHTRILTQPNSHDSLRVLVIVGKKIYKKAYLRNRIRRKIHAILEVAARDGNYGSFDIAIHVLKKDILTLDQVSLEKELLPKVKSLYKM